MEGVFHSINYAKLFFRTPYNLRVGFLLYIYDCHRNTHWTFSIYFIWWQSHTCKNPYVSFIYLTLKTSMQCRFTWWSCINVQQKMKSVRLKSFTGKLTVISHRRSKTTRNWQISSLYAVWSAASHTTIELFLCTRYELLSSSFFSTMNIICTKCILSTGIMSLLLKLSCCHQSLSDSMCYTVEISFKITQTQRSVKYKYTLGALWFHSSTDTWKSQFNKVHLFFLLLITHTLGMFRLL